MPRPARTSFLAAWSFSVRSGGTSRRGGSQQEARRLIDEVRALREREEALMVQEEERLLEFLQPSQVLLLQYLRDQFGNRIRRLGAEDGPVQLRLRGGGPPGGSLKGITLSRRESNRGPLRVPFFCGIPAGESPCPAWCRSVLGATLTPLGAPGSLRRTFPGTGLFQEDERSG